MHFKVVLIWLAANILTVSCIVTMPGVCPNIPTMSFNKADFAGAWYILGRDTDNDMEPCQEAFFAPLDQNGWLSFIKPT